MPDPASGPAALEAPAFVSRFYTSADGLTLHARDYGPADSRALPVVCLPGLARTAADFDVLARRLAAGGPAAPARRVLALDYRGRGLSDWDPDWHHYDIAVEHGDILAVLAGAGIESAAFVGTSRGGLHVMVLATQKPALLRAAVLNDIGPVVENEGLRRISGYVGKLPQPASWAEAAALFRSMNGARFPALSEADWDAYAHLTLQEKDGRLVARYDPALMKTFEGVDLDKPGPTLWPQFDALAPIPLLVIRGANSDLLSQATFEEMARRHEGAEALLVPGQGHAPLLLDAPTVSQIVGFIARADAGAA